MKCSKCGAEFNGDFCTKCGTPADAQSATQPAPQSPITPKKKKGKGCLISFLVVAVISVIVSILVNDVPESTSAKGSQPAQNLISSLAEQSASVPIGKEINNGKVSIKVNSVKEQSSVSDETGYLQYKPNSGGKFVIINITVKNVGKEMYSFVINNFQVQGLDDTQYSPTIMVAKDYLNNGSVNPGLSETGDIGFEVPKDIDVSKLVLNFQEFLSFDKSCFSLKSK